MIERDLHLVEMTGGALSRRACLDRRRGRGDPRAPRRAACAVTCDTAPPYFALNENAVGDYRTFAKLSPPLRGEDDRRAVVAGRRRRHDRLHRQRPRAARPGIEAPALRPGRARHVGLETLLPLLARARITSGELSLLELLAPLTIAPADAPRPAAGPARQGRAGRPGAVRPRSAPGRSTSTKFRSKSKNSPFDGRPVQGRVLRTIVDGRTVFAAEELAAHARHLRSSDLTLSRWPYLLAALLAAICSARSPSA